MNCSQEMTYIILPGDNLYQISRYYRTPVTDILARNPDIDPYNLQVGRKILLCPGEGYTTHPQNGNPRPDPAAQIALQKEMRKVWEQHVYWTRMLLISIAERLPDQEATAARLLKNPADIAAVFANYYSPDVANLIAQLLTEHLQIGGALITALRDGNTAEAERLNTLWYQNADQMAEAFSSINPYYDRETMQNMLYEHLDLTTQEVAARLAKNYPADIQAFDRVEQDALSMADHFSQGIMKQFPQRFG